MSKQKLLTYQTAMQELQSIVSQIQEEAVGIDQLNEKVKRASELIRFCREKLRSTEQEVEEMLKDEG